MKELVEEVKAFCIKHYEEGYDDMVECYSDADLADYLHEYSIGSLKEFIESRVASIERAEDIRSTAF